MKRLFYSFSIHCLGMLLASAAFTSCLSDGDDTIVLENGKTTIAGIPNDADATPNPEIGDNTTSIPNVLYTTEYDGDDAIVRLDMTGIQDASDESGWLKLFGTGFGDQQNIWVEVDGEPKGILVYNTADDQGSDAKVKVDLVFLVDNSGSMSQEADAIARDIVDWSQKLSNSGLDVRYGCVGYDGYINGALNITDVKNLDAFLNYNNYTGTSRTHHFYGADAAVLSEAAATYANSYYECGVAALRFADEHFSFRTGANRIYVNFTDEPNQPNGKEGFSVEYVNNAANWNTSKGTVHTVYSSTTNFTESPLQTEFPWKLSDYTGGTCLTASSSFTGVTLESLPVTGAMMNSYIIRFTNIADLMDGKPHEVKITIVSPDGKTRAERTFYIVFA
ncbi:MAG: vWA domain-containing protein [Prevotella sp.]